MKTHRTCGECINSKPYDEEEFPLLCKKTGIAICVDDCCQDFVPKSEDEKVSDILFTTVKNGKTTFSKLAAAAKKCATTGNHRDLQAYLRLRRETL